ncbi:MAG: PBSX family phage terminase large subunit [Clostridia bacterium]|nr:PBSX family phage terminase large subunit [Clostridia bacterium]
MTYRLSSIVGQGYDDFWNCQKRYRVIKGGKGSKKSSTTALNLIYRLIKYPQSNILVVRAVMNTHRDSTFAQLKWAQQRLGVENLFKNNISPMEMVYLPTGQKILFRGFDDVLKLASTTVEKGYLCFVWIEEAYEIENEADFEKLDLSVPRGYVPPPLFKQVTLTFNPWNEHHWLKKRFFDIKRPNTATYTTNYLINEFLDATDIEVFNRLKRENPRRYAVAGLGEWGTTEGLIYENWQVKDFDKTLLNNPNFKNYFGLDYGYSNDPTAFIAFSVNNKAKEIYVFDEIYKTKMLNCDIAAAIKNKGYAKERIRADSAEPKSNDDLRRLGIARISPSVKGKDSLLNGISKIQEYKIFVKPQCVNTIAELSSYCWKQGSNGNGRNEPCDKNNHLMDAMRYAFYDVKNHTPNAPQKKAEYYITQGGF